MKSNLTKVGILGGSGFTGEELLRILSNHSNSQVIAVSSRELLGRSTNEIVEGSHVFFIAPDTEVFYGCEVIIFATPDGISLKLADKFVKKNITVIDL